MPLVPLDVLAVRTFRTRRAKLFQLSLDRIECAQAIGLDDDVLAQDPQSFDFLQSLPERLDFCLVGAFHAQTAPATDRGFCRTAVFDPEAPTVSSGIRTKARICKQCDPAGRSDK